MAKKKPHAATPALKILEDAGVAHSVSTFEGGTDHFGDTAAEALGIDPDRIFKTLVIDLTAGKGPKRELAVCVLPVSHQLSLKKAAAAFGVSKATMAQPADASKSSGYIPGGISPLGQKQRLTAVVDSSALDHPTVLVSAGRRGMDVELAPADLLALTGATTARIGRP